MIFQKSLPSKVSSSQKNKHFNSVGISLFFRKNKWLILLCGLSLFLLLTFFGSSSGEDSGARSDWSLSDYSATLHQDLESLLSRMNGVGKCSVLITFSDDGERIYALDEERNDSSGGTFSERYEYVLISSRSDGLVLKVHTPSVRGVAVICEGGESTRVKNDVTEVISNTLGISADCISVKKLG